ncbi:MAG: ATP-binding protein [Kiritimatiellae bacterium]|nr:ATP-binding protein [Kiritimatiellia bacterium]
MYVLRQSLENSLISALRGRLHIVIHGESGTGKSWLFKKVLSDESAEYTVANLANASRLGSIAAELKNLVDREETAVKTGYEEEKFAELKPVFASVNLSHRGLYTYGSMEPFEACLKMLRMKAGVNIAALVFDNLEAAFTEPLLKELADLLILCDDERYDHYKVRIIIVGVPSGIKEYYYKTPHHSTIANRLYELPEVSRLSLVEAKTLLRNGLIDELKYSCDNLDSILSHIVWVTDRVPQMLHEYGLELSKLAEVSDRTLTEDLIEQADSAWMFQSLQHAYAVIENHMNERETRAGRRNQTLFALGSVDGEHFRAPEVEHILRKVFPVSTKGTALNIPQMLSHLASGDRPVIKRSPKGDEYSFTDPRLRMVLRAMLVKNNEERVFKRRMSR